MQKFSDSVRDEVRKRTENSIGKLIERNRYGCNEITGIELNPKFEKQLTKKIDEIVLEKIPSEQIYEAVGREVKKLREFHEERIRRAAQHVMETNFNEIVMDEVKRILTHAKNIGDAKARENRCVTLDKPEETREDV